MMDDTKQTPGEKSKSDYSDLPQRPITLKKGIGGLVVPGTRRSAAQDKTEVSSRNVVQKKPVPAKKRSPAMSHWTVRGVSKTARELAMNSAREEGLGLDEWLERAIYRAASEASAQQQPDRAILDSLQDIRNQLDRIELEGGFLYRVWQRIKAQFSKPE